ncbi:MAG: IPT/TIG domain-containing protein, partial [bacterium]
MSRFVTKSMRFFIITAFNLVVLSGFLRAQGETFVLSVIGDVPYGLAELPDVHEHVQNHNLYSPSDFLVHVGDIISGNQTCDEVRYVEMEDALKGLAVPAFIVPGDNEWSDCKNPDKAWGYWTKHLLGIEASFCSPLFVERQSVREDTFAFVHKGVLVIGINIPAGSSANQTKRLQDNADWVKEHFQNNKSQVRAAIILGQAGPNAKRAIFFDQFVPAAAAFGKPVLYMHGDGHSWKLNNPFGESNMVRVQVARGNASNPPVHVTVTMDTQSPSSTFLFEKNPWPKNTQPFNKPPCVEAGPDQMILAGVSAVLNGVATDDGVPTSPGNITVAWSKVSGPGAVSFANAGNASTTATFSTFGTYVLSLAADDGGLSTSDNVTVDVQSDGPEIVIDDVTLIEGNVGSLQAVFTVSLINPDGQGLTVDYSTADSNATAGSDYVASTGVVTFGNNSLSETITVPVNGDHDYEANEVFVVNLSNPSRGTFNDAQGRGMIMNDDLPGAPIISSFTPAEGPCGTEITVTGLNFIDVTGMFVNGTAASNLIVDSNTQLRAVVSPGATTGLISVANTGGTGVSTTAFMVTLVPMITSFTPASGLFGSEVTINGFNFTTATDVSFNGTPASFIIDSDTLVRAQVPVNSTPGKISITNPDGTSASAQDFMVILPPTVTLFSPASAPVGTGIVITGNNFTDVTDVAFNGVSATSVEVKFATELHAEAPVGATTGPISVTNSAGTGASTQNFIVLHPPVIASFTPASGPVGMEVTLAGSNFTGTTGVSFNGATVASFIV